MDTFFEQIVKIKPTAKVWLMYIGIWGLAGLLTFFAFLYLGSLFFVALVGLAYGAWKLSSRFFIEYEYIFTNGDLDFDKIIAKSSRKRMAAISCGKVQKYGKYNWQQKPSASVQKVYTFCDAGDENAVYMIVPNRNEGNVLIVFAPEQRIKEAIEKAIPRIAM